MPHSSSLHYYACYYALVCLLCQQEALSVTIIIDGATTNEWATRDEYQRLVDNNSNNNGQQGPAMGGGNQAGSEFGGSGGDQATGDQRVIIAAPIIGGNEPRGALGRIGGGGGSSREAAAEILAELLARTQAAENGPGADSRQLLGQLAPPHNAEELNEEQLQQVGGGGGGGGGRIVPASQANSFRGQQQHSTARSSANSEEVDLVLDRLDLMSRLQELQNTQQQPARGSFTADGGNRHVSTGLLGDGQAMSMNSLVPGSRHRPGRETPRKLCGPKLTEALELVCQSRYYVGKSEPEVVNPVIKSKRSANNDYMTSLSSSSSSSSLSSLADNEAASPHSVSVSRRRKLRTLQDQQQQQQQQQEGGDGGPSTSSSTSSSSSLTSSLSVNNGINTPHNQQHQQQFEYLSNNNNKYNNQNQQKADRKALLRRIRGASAECCARSCYMEDLKPYCLQ